MTQVAAEALTAVGAVREQFEPVPRSRGHRRPNPSTTRTAVARTTPDWTVVFSHRYGPLTFAQGRPMDVGAHPHTGIQTVTWLLDGELVHHDSLGYESLLRASGVNVMTSGIGIAHAEHTPAVNTGRLNGVQLWVALPDQHRQQVGSFQHLDRVPLDERRGGLVQVFAGNLMARSLPRRTSQAFLAPTCKCIHERCSNCRYIRSMSTRSLC